MKVSRNRLEAIKEQFKEIGEAIKELERMAEAEGSAGSKTAGKKMARVFPVGK